MAGIIAQVGTPYCGLTCLAAYSAFFSDNAGSYTVRKHEMSSHTCWKTSEKLNVEESPPQKVICFALCFLMIMSRSKVNMQ